MVARSDGSHDYASALAIDSAGNLYVTGSIDDFATIKYDANGNQLWVARYNGLGNGYDVASVIVLDPVGNVYVTGASDGSGTGFGYATVKYSQK
jgi:hypothetical protein